MQKIKFLIIVCLLNSSLLCAWGPTGHRTVAYIAKQHLDKATLQNIEKVLGHTNLALVSIYMDEVKSDDRFDHTHNWHWVTLPKGKTYKAISKNPKGDIIWAIRWMCDSLKSRTLSDSLEALYLKMLIHLVGDVHMPLHVGNAHDRGGNDVDVKFFWNTTNLHRVWDSEMIDFYGMSYTELAYASTAENKTHFNDWYSDTLMVWALESQALLPKVYDLPEDHEIGFEYMYYTMPIVRKRLYQAGIRLAAVLNSLYGTTNSN